MVKVKIKRVHPDAIIPKYAHEGDSGMDVYSIQEEWLRAESRKSIETGLQFEVPMGYEIQVRPKSGIALDKGITVLNTPGTIDAPYRGNLKVILINHTQDNYLILKGQKLAQIVLKKVEKMVFEEVKELSKTSRGEGGFGSTGK